MDKKFGLEKGGGQKVQKFTGHHIWKPPRIKHLKMTNDPKVIMQVLRDTFEEVGRLHPWRIGVFDIMARSFTFISHGRHGSKLRAIYS